jgi:ribosome-associated protein
MIRIMNDLFVPDSELNFTASRSGGPGGQNVNKVSSRVTLSFDVTQSSVLSEEQKRKILAVLGGRISKDGLLRIVSQRSRSQELNRADVIERFAELVRKALTPKRTRIKTRTPTAARERRLHKKKKRTTIKQARSKKDWDL